MMMEIEISYFERADRPADPKIITIGDFINLIKGGEMKSHCDKLRSMSNKEDRAKYKRENFPGVTMGGKFSYRKKTALTAASGYAVLDFDIYTDQSQEIRRSLLDDPYVSMIFESPSGGQKAIVKIPVVNNDEEYRIVYIQLLDHFKQYGPSMDESNKDISRLCFTSYDPNIIINKNSAIFPVDWTKAEEKPKQTLLATETLLKDDGSIDRSRVEFRKLISLIRNKIKKAKSITEIRNECAIEMSVFEKWNSAPEHYRQQQFTQALNYAMEKEKETKLELIGVKSAIEKGIPEINYIVDPFLRDGGITIIGGEPGAKKSLLAMMFSICIAKGEELFDKFKCAKKKVCYLDFENGYAVMVNRYNSLLNGNYAGNTNDMDEVTLSVFNDLKLDNPNSKAVIREIIDITGADVFIIDSLVRCMEGEEDKATDVRKVFDNLKDFMAEGHSFVILHHTRKDSNRGMMGLRGSSDLGGMAEIVLMLYSSGDKGKFTNCSLAKHRHLGLEASEDWGFRIDEELFGEKSNFLKLLYYERDPESVSKAEECRFDIIQWVEENYRPSETFKTGAVVSAMDKLGGYNRLMVNRCLKEILTKQIIGKGTSRGLWIVK